MWWSTTVPGAGFEKFDCAPVAASTEAPYTRVLMRFWTTTNAKRGFKRKLCRFPYNLEFFKKKNNNTLYFSLTVAKQDLIWSTS